VLADESLRKVEDDPLTTLIPILGDQLSYDLSSLRDADPAATVILMAEAEDETTYVRHHRRKLAYILSAMRHHAEALRERGWTVEYVKLDDPDNSHSFSGEVARAMERHEVTRIVVTEAGEWRVHAMLDAWETLFGVLVEIRTDTRFMASHADFEAFAEGRAVREGIVKHTLAGLHHEVAERCQSQELAVREEV